jgi:hypothetical protein
VPRNPKDGGNRTEDEPAEAGSKIKRISGAELLAAAGAAGAQDLATPDGRRAGAKAVAAGAHEVARLESALHGEILENDKKRPPSKGGPVWGRG